VEIEEVSDILGLCRTLRLPKHIFITDEPVEDEKTGTRYRGLQPRSRGDVIFLSAQADGTTVPHEAWHAMTGLGELSAYPIGNLLARKHQMLSQFPKLKSMLSRKVHYKEIFDSEDFPAAKKYGKRVRHFILEVD